MLGAQLSCACRRYGRRVQLISRGRALKWMMASGANLLVLYIALVTAAAPGASAATANFCKSPSTNPFARPLQQLPPLANPPENVNLPFAPLLRLRPVGGPLAPKGDKIGYVLSNGTTSDRNDARRPWEIVSILSRLKGPRHDRQVVAQTVRLVYPDDRKARLTFDTQERRRGTYRIDLVFRRHAGRKYGHYSTYVRILPRLARARLTLRRRKITPGQLIMVRLENVGTVHLGAGYGYRLEQFTEGTWRTATALQDSRVVPRVLVLVGPLSTFDCAAILVPQDQPRGRYRIIKDIWDQVGDGKVHQKASASAEFTIE